MSRLIGLLLGAVLVLSACVEPTTTTGTDGKPLPKVYRIRAGDANKVQFRMLDSVNALRAASGLTALSFDARLNAAAATHARDMSNQNRPWLFGSDGSSPLDRVQRAGFSGQFVGEVISESFETELETLAAWMEDPGSRGIILSRAGTRMGFAWFQESNGKIWWDMVIGQ